MIAASCGGLLSEMTAEVMTAGSPQRWLLTELESISLCPEDAKCGGSRVHVIAAFFGKTGRNQEIGVEVREI